MGLYFFHMITDTLVKISTAAILTFNQMATPLVPAQEQVLASHEMSLDRRYYPVQKENILLNLAYMDGRVKATHPAFGGKTDINWDEIQKPFKYEFKLDPNKTFAYHDDILPEYKDSLARTTQAHFNFSEGFKTAGYMFGDGVCHLASLIYWVALDAGLKAEAPRNHDFMPIPEIEKKYGVSIYSSGSADGSNTQQNLYITNSKSKVITFKFDYNGDKLKVSILQEN